MEERKSEQPIQWGEFLKEIKNLSAEKICNKAFDQKLNLRENNRYNEMFKFFNLAIEKDPQYIRAVLNKGWVLGKLGCPEEAIKCFKEAIEIDREKAKEWLLHEVGLGTELGGKETAFVESQFPNLA